MNEKMTREVQIGPVREERLSIVMINKESICIESEIYMKVECRRKVCTIKTRIAPRMPDSLGLG